MIPTTKNTQDIMREEGLVAKPHVQAPPIPADTQQKICLCGLSGEFHCGIEMCEVCDSSVEFTMENVNKAFRHLYTQMNNVMEECQLTREENSKLLSIINQKPTIVKGE